MLRPSWSPSQPGHQTGVARRNPVASGAIRWALAYHDVPGLTDRAGFSFFETPAVPTAAGARLAWRVL
jgi:hypothetical protein